MSKPVYARIRIIGGPRPRFEGDVPEGERTEQIIEEDQLLPEDEILEYIPDEN